MKPKVIIRKEVIKIRAETNEIGNRKAMENISKTHSWFFGKIDKIHNKLLARLIKKKQRGPW